MARRRSAVRLCDRCESTFEVARIVIEGKHGIEGSLVIDLCSNCQRFPLKDYLDQIPKTPRGRLGGLVVDTEEIKRRLEG